MLPHLSARRGIATPAEKPPPCATPPATFVSSVWVSAGCPGLSWFLGRNADAERYARQAVATLEPLDTGAELAMAYSNLSQLQMLSGITDRGARLG